MWSVVGPTTNVEISGPSLSNPLTNLQAEDAISVSVDSTSLFVLAAFNGDQKSSQNIQVGSQRTHPHTVAAASADGDARSSQRQDIRHLLTRLTVGSG